MRAMATVLVVDDEPIVREVVVRYLVARGLSDARGRATATRRAALIERDEPDLVVLDVMLPGNRRPRALPLDPFAAPSCP